MMEHTITLMTVAKLGDISDAVDGNIVRIAKILPAEMSRYFFSTTDRNLSTATILLDDKIISLLHDF